MTTSSRRLAVAPAAIVLAGLCCLTAGSPGLAAAAEGPGGSGPIGTAPRPQPTGLMTERAPATSPRYWTRARMAAAKVMTTSPDNNSSRTVAPARASTASVRTARVRTASVRTAGASSADVLAVSAGARWTRGWAVARSTGRVFFTLEGTDYSCSGSAVGSVNASVVITAGHCVSDGAGRWATNWIFVPGYRPGDWPYGGYPARTYFAAAGWTSHGDEADDVAFVVVKPTRVRGAVRDLTAVVPGQRIGFGRRAITATAFGYPSDPPYTGRHLDYCAGRLLADPYGSADAGLNCSMTEGASGGPWFSGFNPRTGRGTITGVTTFRYADDGRTLYSADLGATAKALYEKAQHTKV